MSRVIVTPDAPGSRLVCEGLQPQRRAGGDPNHLWPLISQHPLNPHTTAYHGVSSGSWTTTSLAAQPLRRAVRAVTRGNTRMLSATNGCKGRRSRPLSTRQPSVTLPTSVCVRSASSSRWRLSRIPTRASSRTLTETPSRYTNWTRPRLLLSPVSRSKRSARRDVKASATSTSYGTR
jgi:hypothetical protein